MTMRSCHAKDVSAGLDPRRLCNRLAGTASSPQTADRLAGSRRGGDGPGGDISLSDFLGRLLGEFTATLDEELCHGADGAVLQDDDANRRVAKWLFDGQDF